MKQLYSVFILLLCLCACLNRSEKKAAPPVQEIPVADSTVSATPDTIRADTAQVPNVGRGPASVTADTVEVEGSVSATGELIFYCPKKLKEGQSVHVIASLSNGVARALASERMLNQVNSQQQSGGEEHITANQLDYREVAILDSVKLELSDPSNRIDIKPESDQTVWRKLNKGETEDWSWYLIPKKEEGGKAPVRLYLKAFTKNEGLPPRKTIQQYYTLTIDLPETVWQAFLRKLRDIDWLVGMIGAIGAYFLGMWQERKKQKQAK